MFGTVTPANKSPPVVSCAPIVFKLPAAPKSTVGVVDLNGFSISGKSSNDNGAISINENGAGVMNFNFFVESSPDSELTSEDVGLQE